ncbi:suppressor of fused domain protein [Spiractinospora alimapuensis]|uniref:suppressor of fused domain protein n=1 Tax=Spiractinospora alimapuensis TaxID=2820884 RepID=UPI001F20718D|nr:suppressor of fused domain protein [Spiractinospora alimapuensis]QVQ54313.1 suppressor of fused domain protein [Spiractinospora alimapuensis]
MDHEETDAAPGWDAIDAALSPVYPDTDPLHYAPEVPWALGGENPLDGVSLYPRAAPVPHWHIVTYGMSELYGKESDDPEESGWGFEFTMRATGDTRGDSAPMWPVTLLGTLAKYVYDNGNPFAPGHTIGVNGPINPERPETAIRAITFVEDPELGSIDTDNGRVTFLQVVGITEPEYEAARGGGARGLLDSIGPRLPLFVTDDARGSLLN